MNTLLPFSFCISNKIRELHLKNTSQYIYIYPCNYTLAQCVDIGVVHFVQINQKIVTSFFFFTVVIQKNFGKIYLGIFNKKIWIQFRYNM